MKRAISLKGILVFNFIIVILITILFSGMNLFYKNKLGKKAAEIDYSGRQIADMKAAIADSEAHLNIFLRSASNDELMKFYNSSALISECLGNLAPVISKDHDLLLYSRIISQINESREDYLNQHFVNLQSEDGTALFQDIQHMTFTSSELNKNFYNLANAFITVNNQSLEEMQRSYFTFYYRQFFILLSFFLLYSLFFILFIRSLVKTLREVTDTANQLSFKQWNTGDIKPSRFRELNSVAVAFNQMRGEIIRYLDKLKHTLESERILHEHELEFARHKELINESRYRMLQMQINPHFIFNTLNMIIRMVQCGEKDTAAILLKSTSDLLRNSIEIKEACISLSRELLLLDSYLTILKERVEDRVTISLEIGDIDRSFEIPPFTIQPLVENSVKHGLAYVTHDGIINIRLEQYEDHILITVEDNGNGCDQQMFDDILSGESDLGIGIRNIQERLRLLYEKDDVVRITSSITSGTRVAVKIYRRD